MAFVPAAADSPEAVSRGPWEHLSGLPKAELTARLGASAGKDGWTGTVAVVPPCSNEPELVVRTIRAARRTASALGWVVVDATR